MPIELYGRAQSKPRFSSYSLIAALVAALIVVATASPAAAQQPAPTSYDQEQLAAFAAAAQRIQELNRKWLPQINQAGSAQDGDQLREQAMEEMKAAVHQEGLTVEEYNQIYDAAQRDPAVMQEIEEHRESLE